MMKLFQKDNASFPQIEIKNLVLYSFSLKSIFI